MYRSSKLNEERVHTLKTACNDSFDYNDAIAEKDSIKNYLPPSYLDDEYVCKPHSS